MAFRSFNKLTNAFLGEVKFDSRTTLNNKIKSIFNARQKLNVSLHERLELLHKISRMVESNKQQLADIISQETGKYEEDSEKEIEIAIKMLRQNDKYIASYFHPEILPVDKNKKTKIQLYPIGPVYCVHSSYKPLWHLIRSILINTRIGNPSLLRPSTKNPLVAKTFENILKENHIDFVEIAYNSPEDFKHIISNDRIKGVYVSANL